MEDAKPEVLFERIEVAVAMQQGVAMHDTESGDQAIDRSTDGDAGGSKMPIILRAEDGEIIAAGIEYFEVGQFFQSLCKDRIQSNALQHFAKNPICKTYSFDPDMAIKPDGMVVMASFVVVDPDA
jgi:hypothetical protein